MGEGAALRSLRRLPRARMRHMRHDCHRQPQQGDVRVPWLSQQDQGLAGVHPLRVQAPLSGTDGDANCASYDDLDYLARLLEVMTHIASGTAGCLQRPWDDCASVLKFDSPVTL